MAPIPIIQMRCDADERAKAVDNKLAELAQAAQSQSRRSIIFPKIDSIEACLLV